MALRLLPRRLRLSLFLAALFALLATFFNRRRLDGFELAPRFARLGAGDEEHFDVYRMATRGWSLLQLALYITGVVCFVLLIRP